MGDNSAGDATYNYSEKNKEESLSVFVYLTICIVDAYVFYPAGNCNCVDVLYGFGCKNEAKLYWIRKLYPNFSGLQFG